MALALMAGGCAVHSPVSIASIAGSLPAEAAVDLAPFEADGSLRGTFGAALVEALEAQSVSTAQGAPIIAEFAVAVRSAETGIADPAQSTAENVDWESRPRPGSWLDSCDATRLRATLLLLDRAEGTIRYRGVAETNDCDYEDSDFAELAAALVRDAKGELAPR